jgi:hypothetical protein
VTKTLQQQVLDTQVLLLRQPTAAAAAAWATCRALGAGLAAAAAPAEGVVVLQIFMSCSADELQAGSCLAAVWFLSGIRCSHKLHTRHSQQPGQQHPTADLLKCAYTSAVSGALHCRFEAHQDQLSCRQQQQQQQWTSVVAAAQHPARQHHVEAAAGAGLLSVFLKNLLFCN